MGVVNKISSLKEGDWVNAFGATLGMLTASGTACSTEILNELVGVFDYCHELKEWQTDAGKEIRSELKYQISRLEGNISTDMAKFMEKQGQSALVAPSGKNQN